MYDLKLKHSNFPVQNDDQIEAVKVGGILRQIAARHGRAVAMVDVDEVGRCGNQWTYIAMLDDAE